MKIERQKINMQWVLKRKVRGHTYTLLADDWIPFSHLLWDLIGKKEHIKKYGKTN